MLPGAGVMLCGIGGFTDPLWVTMCSYCRFPLPAWIAMIFANVFGFSDFQTTIPACSPLALMPLVFSRVVNVHSPFGAFWSTVLDASASLAMKSPWRIGTVRLPPPTTGPPLAGRSTVHWEPSVLPSNSSEPGRQAGAVRSIRKLTEPGGSATLPARSRERNSIVCWPAVETLNVVTNGSAEPVFSRRV